MPISLPISSRHPSFIAVAIHTTIHSLLFEALGAQPLSFYVYSVDYSPTMVLGVERINARIKQPNDRINFIKPLKGVYSSRHLSSDKNTHIPSGPHERYSQDFLERIAAICNPVMKKNGLAVMSLEEYEYNTEFLGRNFNAGEVIQLVLKSRSGNWLPFRFVQMVMMHELAHCK